MCKILLTKEERKALVVLHSDATHGPWAYESDGDNGNFNIGIVLDDDDKPISGYVEDNTCIVVDVVAREVEGSANAAFIVGAYNAFPRLLYGLEVLEARAEQAAGSLRESISKQDEMAAEIEKLAAANVENMRLTKMVDWMADKLGTRHPDCPLKYLKQRPLGWKCHEGSQGPCTKAQAAGCWAEAARLTVEGK